MRIKTKLMLGSVVMIAVLLVLASAGINNINIQSKQLKELYVERYQKMLDAYQIRSEINETAKLIANILTVPTSDSLDRNVPEMEKAQEEALASLHVLRTKTETEIEKEMVEQTLKYSKDYFDYTFRVVAEIQEGRSEEAILLREREGLTLQTETAKLATEMANYHRIAMDNAFELSIENNNTTLTVMSAATLLGLLVGIGAMLLNMRSLGRGLQTLSVMIRGFAQGTIDATTRVEHISNDEFGDVAKVFNALADDLEQRRLREQAYNQRMEEEAWVASQLAAVVMNIQGTGDLAKVSRSFIGDVASMTGSQYGALYIRDGYGEHDSMRLQGGYAYSDELDYTRKFALGQGLVGQCAQEGKPLEVQELPADYIRIQSGLGAAQPHYLLLQPLRYEGHTLGVLELAALRPFTDPERRLIDEASENFGIIINNLFGRMRVEELLRESQTLTEELQVQSEELLSQQEELRSSNEKLEEHAKQLKKSEEMLQSQQEELEQSNEELLQKTHMLELQMKQTEQKNEQIEKTRATLEKQTVQLALSSKYKSEFLTNMSHELRTPLNSLLILSQMLADNRDGNLTSKQIEFAGTIHSSGSDLLKLIDEILDLSKISAGKMDVVIEHVPLGELEQYFRRSFKAIGEERGIGFEIRLDDNVPKEIYTDSHRVKQILKNLLSNAFKFTSHGAVELTIRSVGQGESDAMESNAPLVAFEVKDTGIGIPADKQDLIFEAFQQVDGTTSRIYGGTGLGLAISRDLAGLLGGSINLESEEGKGSIFTLYLPEFHVAGEQHSRQLHDSVLNTPMEEPGSNGQAELTGVVPAIREAAAGFSPQSAATTGTVAEFVEDDRDQLGEQDKVVLIIEDDLNFAKVLLDIARARGFKGIVALQGDKGLAYVWSYKPDAILLDIQLPVMDGWTVLNQLKHHADTRHIPVHVISVVDEIQQGLSMGALAYVKKPTSKENLDQLFTQIESFLERDLKRLLVVEDDAVQRNSIVELIGHDDVSITAVSTGREALEELALHHYDCMVLDLGLPDMTGFELLDEIRRNDALHDLPIIIYTGRELDKKEELRLKKYAGTIIIKDVKSPERLLDETTLFLHRVEANLPEDKRSLLRKLHSIETIFEGKHILIVDDDIRNVFALSSVLENYKMTITFAENGREALEQLEKNPGIQLVLMDIMMPEMDGYEAMREIRAMPMYDKLPIIAVTAKAMKDDRDKCIDAGASDYIAKPVNTEQLLSLMRVWLYK
ncbi:response regulator [Paenibacillaceae bacterium]|nr:response regulator [Paenibacillaceae bacterium]